MGDHHDREIVLLSQVIKESQDSSLDGDIESSRRFICDEKFRITSKGHRDCDALTHTAGELTWMCAKRRSWIWDLDGVEELQDLRARRTLGDLSVMT